MILLCEHPVFTGCESAQSTHRSGLRRPGAPAGCSRCERSLDTRPGCAASSRVVPLTCVLPPPWPLPLASGDSDADTACETGDRIVLPPVPLPPATTATGDCLAC